MNRTSDTLFVCFEFANNIDDGVLVVGRERLPNQPIKILNILHGEEAERIYDLLVTKKP